MRYYANERKVSYTTACRVAWMFREGNDLMTVLKEQDGVEGYGRNHFAGWIEQ